MTGATSQIGHFLLPMLDGHTLANDPRNGERTPVLALSRRRPGVARGHVCWLQGALPAAPAIESPLRAAVSFGPIDAFAAWLDTAPLGPSPRVVATSSMSAESKRESIVASERAISQRLRDGEQRLIDVCNRRGIAWTILRPTLIYGVGLDRSLTPIARRAMRTRLFAYPDAPGLRQPVHAQDVAQAALRALERDAAVGVTFPLGGGERITAGEMFRRVRASLPVAALPIPLPVAPLKPLSQLHGALRGPVSRLTADLVADNTELRQRLDVHPRPFRPTASAWGLDTP
ncbi:nucleoside-diphosphate sugar epimerase [Lysobacter bugurensis]|uniref:Nucleoside-diphosphate sugar epimerase n=1 Tax=Cognatilysobacter bugurensis TaxID=543356 RepID=A0A918W971_9GAMM|nr:nucleoside-diphosphate sugar epimerase [Lysobacter bugurensis]